MILHSELVVTTQKKILCVKTDSSLNLMCSSSYGSQQNIRHPYKGH